jgi:hypothetical protein
VSLLGKRLSLESSLMRLAVALALTRSLSAAALISTGKDKSPQLNRGDGSS